MKIEDLKATLKQLGEPRRTTKGNILHKPEDIIIIGLCSLICNGSDFVDMEEFGEARQEWPGLKSIGAVKTKRVCQEQEYGVG